VQITTADGKTFTLTRETEIDHQLLDQLEGARSAYVIDVQRTTQPGGGFATDAVSVVVDRLSEPALVAQSGRQALSALGQLFSLGLGEAAQHGHVSTTATNPQAQEQLASSLVQLQMMLQALRDVVVKQEIVVQKISCAHGSPLFVAENAIVKE
jgi:hypothetical protein